MEKIDESGEQEHDQVMPITASQSRRRAYPPGYLWCCQAWCPSHGGVVAFSAEPNDKLTYICSLCMIETAVSCFGTVEEVTMFSDKVANVAGCIKPVPQPRRSRKVVQQ